MYLNEFAKEVHQNAVAHGWWGEEYTDAAVIALIHAEISEALEEWRNNRPMVYHLCDLTCNGVEEICDESCAHYDAGDCAELRQQPEPHGIAVELIDVVLRILDAAAAWGIGILQGKSIYTVTDAAGNPHVIAELTLPELVCYLHQLTTSLSFYREKKEFDGTMVKMSEIILLIFTWLEAHEILYPESILRQKHAYNQTRPHKHGGKRV